MQGKDLYSGIDLHSNNHYLAILDEADHRVFEKRLRNQTSAALDALAPFREHITECALTLISGSSE